MSNKPTVQVIEDHTLVEGGTTTLVIDGVKFSAKAETQAERYAASDVANRLQKAMKSDPKPVLTFNR